MEQEHLDQIARAERVEARRESVAYWTERVIVPGVMVGAVGLAVGMEYLDVGSGAFLLAALAYFKDADIEADRRAAERRAVARIVRRRK